jgi:DNA-directed RNA polymerase subunit RPC12/RpoP
MDVSVEIHCETCGSANYSLPDGMEDESAIRCNDCGAPQGTIGALRATLLEQVFDHSAEALRRDLDRLLAAKL